ncbi:MAG TPA: sorbosone dehydrogenase family protein [Roseiarcus sp.]|nr:sorbosone dehydrogenase family protein [Roseiarcus sp.]
MRAHVKLAAVSALFFAAAGAAQPASLDSGAVRTGAAAYGDWRTDAPGVRRKITAADLPAPFASAPAANPSRVVARPPSAELKTPPGFSVSLFAKGLREPRVVRVAPNGDIFVAESAAGQVRVFRAADGAATPEKSEVFVSGLDRPFGIAFYPPGPDPRYVYVATNTEVIRYPYHSGGFGPAGPSEVVAPSLPGRRGHWTRDIVFSLDGKTMFVSVGSASNVAEDMPPLNGAELSAFVSSHALGASWGAEEDRADVLAFDPDGRNKRVFATGIRNCSGLTVEPENGALWCATNERDILGDDLPPDFATSVKEGAFYGWPWYYIGANQDPRHKGERTDLADKIAVPDVLIQPHSAPLGMIFYEAGQFPADYKGDAFIALHGSWNRAKRTGYKIVRLIFKDGRPTGEYEDFLTGFVVDDSNVWGRPVDVAVAHDGALLLTDDGGDAIWRVAYKGE